MKEGRREGRGRTIPGGEEGASVDLFAWTV
jgi:hypothetical protein